MGTSTPPSFEIFSPMIMTIFQLITASLMFLSATSLVTSARPALLIPTRHVRLLITSMPIVPSTTVNTRPVHRHAVTPSMAVTLALLLMGTTFLRDPPNTPFPTAGVDDTAKTVDTAFINI